MRRIVLIYLILFLAQNAYGGVLFETNFDNVTDWSMNAGSDPYALYIDASDTTPQTGDVTGNYPYWTAIWVHQANTVTTTAIERQVTSGEDHTGTGGKSHVYVIEKNGTWRGGRINIGLDETPAEIYMAVWIKYQDDFHWGTLNVGHGYQKLLIMGCYPNILSRVGTLGYLGHGTDYPSAPLPILDYYYNKSYGYAQLVMFERGADPDHVVLNEPALGTDANYPGNGWHHYEWRSKLNSSPGVSDGEWEVWLDGVSVGSASNVNWIASVPWQSGHTYSHIEYPDSSPTNAVVIPTSSLVGFLSLANHTSGGAEPNWSAATQDGDIVSDGNGNQWKRFSYCWNTFNFGDNHDFESWNDTNEIEELMYFDDIVISTEYVGPNYEVGSGPDTTPPTISNISPTTQQSCTTDPQSITLSCTTNELATCRYGADGSAWSAMSEMATTGGTSHSQSLSLDCGDSYQYDIICQDASENESDPASADFDIADAAQASLGGLVGVQCHGCVVYQ